MKSCYLRMLIAVCIVYACTKARAQYTDSLRARYQQQTLQFFRGYAALGENGERIPQNELRNYFTVSPEGLQEFDASKQKIRTARWLGLSGLAVVVGGLIIHNNSNGKFLPAFVVGFGEGIIISSIPIGFSGQKKFAHAVWLRNRDAVFGTAK